MKTTNIYHLCSSRKTVKTGSVSRKIEESIRMRNANASARDASELATRCEKGEYEEVS